MPLNCSSTPDVWKQWHCSWIQPPQWQSHDMPLFGAVNHLVLCAFRAGSHMDVCNGLVSNPLKFHIWQWLQPALTFCLLYVFYASSTLQMDLYGTTPFCTNHISRTAPTPIFDAAVMGQLVILCPKGGLGGFPVLKPQPGILSPHAIPLTGGFSPTKCPDSSINTKPNSRPRFINA